jgi:hypothetical protein
MKQLSLFNESLCVEDILYHPEILNPSVNADLYELLLGTKILEIVEINNYSQISCTIDWLKKYTKANRLDIIKRAIQIAIENLAKRLLALQKPLYICDRVKCTRQEQSEIGPDRDGLRFSIRIFNE